MIQKLKNWLEEEKVKSVEKFKAAQQLPDCDVDKLRDIMSYATQIILLNSVLIKIVELELKELECNQQTQK